VDDVVKVMVPAANHDPRHFPHPDVFDPARTSRGSLIFGLGPHHCIGSLYAKEEVTALLEFLLRHVRAIEPAGPTTRTLSSAFVGSLSVPVVLRGR
jgi:cytochrome P450